MSTTIDQHSTATRSRGRSSRRPAPDGGGEGSGILNAFSHTFLALWSLLIIAPVVWIVLGAFKTTDQIGSSAWTWPKSWSFGAFVRAWTSGNIGLYFFNTVIVMVFSVTLTLLLGAMAAYVLARYEFRGSRAVYYMFVAGAMFPVYLALVPLYFTIQRLHMLNTYQGLVVVYVAYSLPFTVFFLHSFFRTQSTAVHEAAMLDGCSHTRAFFSVMLPMAKPGLVSVGIFNVIGQWNQYILPTVLMNRQSGFDKDHSMLAQGLATLALSQGYSGDYPRLFAGMTLAMVPVLVVYLVFQRQVQAGLTAATVK